ncbi:MAG TPA: hypothetical protein VLC48_07120 [Gemmatimonadota bacterium]|nr:hypothetical protein [Gemmatimonadota bacterium]
MTRAWALRSTSGGIALLLALTSIVAAQVPPDQKYLQFETDHFRVIFPDGMEMFARRAAASAEWAYDALAEHFTEPPDGRIALVITDYTDRPNASATPIPSNRVVLIAAPQLAVRQLNYYSDWLDNALVHELTHIFHLDDARGVWTAGRFLFGRLPVFFPAFYQPQWVVEGLPTYYESRLTGAGRAYGSAFNTLLGNDAGAGSFRTIDAADGLSPIFPAGNAPYAYGGLYFRDVAEQHGDSVIGELIRKGAIRLPYTLNWASTSLYGRTLTGSWSDWRADFQASERRRVDSLQIIGLTAPQPLSDFAWSVSAPRYSPDGDRLAFTYNTPRDDAATLVVDSETGAAILRRRRNGSGGLVWARDGSVIYLSQVEYADRYDIYSDLYAIDARNGDERRLTFAGRFSSPDIMDDGRSLVAVETREGTNRLVELELETFASRPVTPFQVGVNWEHPRVSPDGRYIAAERWVEGEVLDIVVIDLAGRLMRRVTDDQAADVSPAWSRDGRYLLWASDRDGVYDIYAVEASALWEDQAELNVQRVTRTAAGAADPDVSPDGRWLAFTALHAQGQRIERIPFDPTSWEDAGPNRRSLRRPAAPVVNDRPLPDAPVHSYNPFPSLWPKAWLPVVAFSSGDTGGDFIGALVTGTDDVRRHNYALLAGWRTGVDKPEARISYAYAGFGDPVLRISVSQEYDENLRTSGGTVFTTLDRERDLIVTADFLRPRMRSAFRVTPGLGLQEVRLVPSAGVQLVDSTFTDLEALLGISYSRARRFPRSVSLEKGWSASLLLSHQRLADDLDRWEAAAEGLLRGYLSFPAFGFANHVLAARLSFGVSEANARGTEIFELGGVPGGSLPLGLGIDVGSGEQYAVRGYDEGAQFGDRVASASLEYRLPLALVGRGYGLWPVLLDRLSASVFVDGGSAWFDSSDIDLIGSAGVELSVDLGLNYAALYRFRTGFALPFDSELGDPTVYLAFGAAF